MTVKRIAVRADAYAIPGVTVDGNDPDAVYEAASFRGRPCQGR